MKNLSEMSSFGFNAQVSSYCWSFFNHICSPIAFLGDYISPVLHDMSLIQFLGSQEWRSQYYVRSIFCCYLTFISNSFTPGSCAWKFNSADPCRYCVILVPNSQLWIARHLLHPLHHKQCTIMMQQENMIIWASCNCNSFQMLLNSFQ